MPVIAVRLAPVKSQRVSHSLGLWLNEKALSGSISVR
jgi:hypothetical protein